MDTMIAVILALFDWSVDEGEERPNEDGPDEMCRIIAGSDFYSSSPRVRAWLWGEAFAGIPSAAHGHFPPALSSEPVNVHPFGLADAVPAGWTLAVMS